MNSEQQTQQADDPSGPEWRDVEPDELLQDGDMLKNNTGLWLRTRMPGRFAREGFGGTYRRRIEPQPQPEIDPDDPSGPGWRDVGPDEILQAGDMVLRDSGKWAPTRSAGKLVLSGLRYRRRIEPEPQPEPEPEPQTQADDPSGEGWRDVGPDEIIQAGDMFKNGMNWERSNNPGWKAKAVCGVNYRRRIEPEPSDSEQETMQDLRRRLAECEALLAEAERGGEQANAELQQLREQLQTLTRERDRYRNQLAGAIEHSKAPEAQALLVDRLQTWLRPVLEVVADHPDHSSILAVSVLEFLPQIASRLIEE